MGSYDPESDQAQFGAYGQNLFSDILWEEARNFGPEFAFGMTDVRRGLQGIFPKLPEEAFMLSCLEKTAGDFYIYGKNRCFFVEVCSTRQSGDYMWIGRSKLELCKSDYVALMAFSEDGKTLRSVQLVETRVVKNYAEKYVAESGWKIGRHEEIAQIRQWFGKGKTIPQFLEIL